MNTLGKRPEAAIRIVQLFKTELHTTSERWREQESVLENSGIDKVAKDYVKAQVSGVNEAFKEATKKIIEDNQQNSNFENCIDECNEN